VGTTELLRATALAQSFSFYILMLLKSIFPIFSFGLGKAHVQTKLSNLK
jgi:hypothetical protein